MGRHPPSGKPPRTFRRAPELVAAISADVMRYLGQGGFFEQLDDRLCPESPATKRIECDGSYREAERILRRASFTDEDLADFFAVLQARGGTCDCEILCSVVERSRLKAEQG